MFNRRHCFAACILLGTSAFAVGMVADEPRPWERFSCNRLEKVHSGAITSLCISADQKWLVTAARDNEVVVRDCATGQPLHRLGGHRSVIDNLAVFLGKSSDVVTAGDSACSFWKLSDGRYVRQRTVEYEGRMTYFSIRSLAASSDGNLLALGLKGKGALKFGGLANRDRRLDPTSLLVLDRNLDMKEISEAAAYAVELNAALAVAFSPDGKLLAVAGHRQPTKGFLFVTSLDPNSQTVVEATPPAGVACADFSPDGRYVATGLGIIDDLIPKTFKNEPIVVLWDRSTGKEVRRFLGHTGRTVSSVSFSGDGKLLASAGDDRSVRIWDTQSGQQLAHLKHAADKATIVRFAADGKVVVAGYDNGSICLWKTD